MKDIAIRRGYSDSSFGQLHWRIAGERSDKPDLYCLHPAPYSGLAYIEIMPYLAQDRRVIAPDYPGHGGSDPYRHDASIADYASAISQVMDKISDGRPSDLTGFHTGCLVAAETSLIAPQKTRKLALIDIPAFGAETRTQLLKSEAAEFPLTQELSCLDTAWQLGVAKRIESQGIDRSFSMFIEQLRHGRGRNAAFHAGFTYEIEARFAEIIVPTHIIATQSALLEATRRAGTLIPDVQLSERLDITRAVLDEAAETTARAILEAIA